MTEQLNKQDVLNLITQASQQKVISKKELLAAYEEGSQVESDFSRSVSMAQVFSLLGGGIIFLGIAILISQFWHSYSTPIKILLTLGSGVVAYLMAIIFEKDQRVKIMGTSFFLLSALLIPLGLMISLNSMGISFDSTILYILVSLASFIIFLLTFFAFKKRLLLLFSILFASWLFYSIIEYFYPGGNDIELYSTLVLGLSYVLLAKYLEGFPPLAMTGFLYGMGVFLILCACFLLSLDRPIWEFIFPVVIFAVMYTSIRLKSNSFLTFGSIFLVVYILEETEKHFSASMGWPLSLVLAGFLLIACAYLYFRLRKKFF